ncbi:MAG: threonylcarbamoyl-AMP synthase [Lactobacillales bacterium]|jgi:L-threonylcarbamoyladenylate synthase|nr:threonylcarbamoyl-AMP synthase [Lactobacillales bacterium]
METKIINVEEIDEAAKLLQAGELVAFPTETVYGLGADALNREAVSQVYQAKGRPSDNPLIVHVADFAQVQEFVKEIPQAAKTLVEKFWPGPLTLIFNVKVGSLPSEVTGGLTTAAFRMPNNEVTLELIKKSGTVLVGPSANTSGKPSPTTAQHVFHDLNGKIAGIVDDGQTRIGVESTVLDLSVEGVATILRPGAITQEMLLDVVPGVSLDKHLVSEEEAPKAPGMKYTHYSPNAEVYMINEENTDWQEAIDWAKKQNLTVGLLADRSITDKFGKEVDATYELTNFHNVYSASQNLFAGLRALDEKQPKIAVIFTETFDSHGLGSAYMNRLQKASGQKYFKK